LRLVVKDKTELRRVGKEKTALNPVGKERMERKHWDKITNRVLLIQKVEGSGF
jgi:hypothetical protein